MLVRKTILDVYKKNDDTMKTLIATLFTSLVLFGFFSFKNPSVENIAVGSGIQFFNGTFKDALLKAEKEHKPIFLDVYATWCGPCKKLKKTTFKDDKVGAYFNANFINIAIDGETKEGRELRRMYQVRSYPSLLILDSGGKIKTRTTGYKNAHILINFGKRIIP